MMTLTDRYRYTYKLTFFAGRWCHDYRLVGRHGGLNLHIQDLGEDYAKRHGVPRFSAGLECHWRNPPEYMANRPPSHDDCWLLKQPCWHDGTSLYAEEHYIPVFNGQNHELIFQMLAGDADEKFGGDDDNA